MRALNLWVRCAYDNVWKYDTSQHQVNILVDNITYIDWWLQWFLMTLIRMAWWHWRPGKAFPVTGIQFIFFMKTLTVRFDSEMSMQALEVGSQNAVADINSVHHNLLAHWNPCHLCIPTIQGKWTMLSFTIVSLCFMWSIYLCKKCISKHCQIQKNGTK